MESTTSHIGYRILVPAVLAFIAAGPVGAEAQFAGPVPVSIAVAPPGPLAPGDPFVAEILIDVGATPLGAYTINFSCDPAVVAVQVDAGTGNPLVSGGNTPEFSDNAIANLLAPCNLGLTAFQFASLDSPTGQVSVALIQMAVLPGAAAGPTAFTLVVDTIASTTGSPGVPDVQPAGITVEAGGAVCGDGNLDVGEDCDDGNNVGGDCCSAACTFELGSCNDGDACTAGDACSGAICAGTPVDCGSGTCDPGTGQCTGGVGLICIAAGAADALLGDMTADATFAGGSDADTATDSLASTLLYADDTMNTFGGGSGDEAHYGVVVPDPGPWFLWGRFYYPGAIGSNDANSFFASVDGGALMKFGNNKGFFQRFHWDGDGNIENGPLTPLALGTLSSGSHTLVIEKREVLPPGKQPRLDVICLSKDGDAQPADAEVAQLIGGQTGCTADGECNDGNACTIDACNQGTCANTPRNCNDGNACTNDSCNPGNGQCTSSAIGCDDGNDCNGAEGCNPASGCTTGVPVNCVDGDACTLDICNPVGGACSNPPLDCGDGNACTADSCDSLLGCFNDALACPDGQSCNPSTGACDGSIVCVAAGSDATASFTGSMTTGLQFTAGADNDPVANNLTTPLVFADGGFNSFDGSDDSSVSYLVDLPDTGPWFLWGRFYYPGAVGGNQANSFFASVDGGALMKFGNNKDFFQIWHWDGDGNIENGPLAGLALPGVGPGVHVLEIRKREVLPEGAEPRLDVLCLTKDGDVPPGDGQF